jgi:UDP-xylose/UDP-N-acetylglucosamine transporter B4
VFIAAMSCAQRVERGGALGVKLRPTHSPLWWYAALTSIFWTLSVLNNMAYDYEISQPLHMVFRSSSLAVSLLLGFLFFRKRYNVPQVLGVAVVTIGIFATTFADSKSAISCGPTGCSAASAAQWFDLAGTSSRKWVGVGILTSGLFLSSLLGHLQSFGYEYWKKKDEQEAM